MLSSALTQSDLAHLTLGSETLPTQGGSMEARDLGSLKTVQFSNPMNTRSLSASRKRESNLHRRREARRALPLPILERNDAVLKHLGLAHLGAERQLSRGDGERDDLIQEGRMGLIRALDRFEPTRGHRLSSYAMPRITGEILHYRRDRLRTLRIPWRLNELHVKGMKIQNDQQQRGQPALDASDLAHRLGVTPQRWQQACIAHQHRHLLSLQSPKQEHATSPHPVSTHLESLPARSTLHNDPQLSWLKTALKSLDPVRRRWLCAHWIDGLSITTIARLEGIDRRTLQRLLSDSLSDLRMQAVAATS